MVWLLSLQFCGRFLGLLRGSLVYFCIVFLALVGVLEVCD